MIIAVNFPIQVTGKKKPGKKSGLSYILHIVSLLSGRYELNKLTSLPMCGFIAQLVEHRTGFSGGHGFESRWSPDFFQASSFQLLQLENLLRWSFFTFRMPSVHTKTRSRSFKFLRFEKCVWKAPFTWRIPVDVRPHHRKVLRRRKDDAQVVDRNALNRFKAREKACPSRDCTRFCIWLVD